ncbi:uncharacterized protein LOC124817817 [Hydra vulgaris]|uniref:uncharacterized protein LOC124817817 n=1 Tax=Hydra vulgaris TaxID=6087 RepID=UPI001F5F1773|nr:uncharacterized protein LOC124817817 [Hydra vulgaris]
MKIMFEKVTICIYPQVKDLGLMKKETTDILSVEIFHNNLIELKCCGFYYYNLTLEESQNVLKDKKPGSYIIRDSSDKSFYYVLSLISEKKKVVNFRIYFHDGKFLFDGALLCSTSVIGLVTLFQKNYSKYSLYKPILKHVPSLLHSSRLVVNQSLQDKSKVPIYIQRILSSYPYEI